MLKNSFRFLVPGAFGTLAALLLLTGTQVGMILGEASPPQQGGLSPETRTTIELERAPTREIKDPYPGFSAVAVDVANDEIILHDENNAQIMVYSRLDDTPDRATLTEPKRIIGGPATNIQMNCGIYVDPFSGDIYSVNGDTADWMGVWTREQRGNVAPTRELEAPHRAFGVVVDEEAQELFMTIQHPPAVVVWPKLAKDQDAPLRILEGDKTQLASAQGITIDTENQWLYVSNVGATSRNSFNQGWSRALIPGSATWEIPNRILDYIPGSGEFRPPSITVHDLKANGDTAPLRVIQGPLTQLNWPAHISVDVESDELFVTNPVTHEILVFRASASASGNVAPIRVLGGPRTGLSHPHGVFVDPNNDELVVANFGNHSSTVYAQNASGDTPPLRTIRAAPADAPAPMFGNIGSATYDSIRDELLVPN
jgi:hypothetical protein